MQREDRGRLCALLYTRLFMSGHRAPGNRPTTSDVPEGLARGASSESIVVAIDESNTRSTDVRLRFARAHDYLRCRVFHYTSEFSGVGRFAFNAMGIQRTRCCAGKLRQLLTAEPDQRQFPVRFRGSLVDAPRYLILSRPDTKLNGRERISAESPSISLMYTYIFRWIDRGRV